jgi:hypothetical protein
MEVLLGTLSTDGRKDVTDECNSFSPQMPAQVQNMTNGVFSWFFAEFFQILVHKSDK